MGRRISIDRDVLVEAFPYMKDYYKLPRKQKKAMKIKVTRAINKAILLYIDVHTSENGVCDLTL